MTTFNDGGPAFPTMTLRDWFAGQASEADVMEWKHVMNSRNFPISREEAKYAYADAMLAARAKGGTA